MLRELLLCFCIALACTDALKCYNCFSLINGDSCTNIQGEKYLMDCGDGVAGIKPTCLSLKTDALNTTLIVRSCFATPIPVCEIVNTITDLVGIKDKPCSTCSEDGCNK